MIEPIHSIDKLISPSFIPNPDILKLFKCIDLLISSLHAIDTDCFLSLNLGGKCTLQSLATETMVNFFFFFFFFIKTDLRVKVTVLLISRKCSATDYSVYYSAVRW